MKSILLAKSGKHNSWKSRHPSAASAMVFLWLISAAHAPAALKTWVGLGVNANWGTSANWSPSGAPANGDDLSFPAGSAQLVNTNNLVRSFSSIAFSGAGGGYDIRGNAFTITNNIQATNTAGVNTIENSITLSTTTITVNVTVSLTLSGALSGSVGLTKTGAGVLIFSGTPANTYAGTTTVNAGSMDLNRTSFDGSIPGDLVIGTGITVRTLRDSQINNDSNIVMNAGSVLDLGTFTEAVGDVSMTGASVIGAGSLFNLLGTLTVNASATQSSISKEFHVTATRTIDVSNGAATTDLLISGEVSGGGGITKTGAGLLSLTEANTYTGVTTVNAGTINAGDNLALGGTAGGTVVNGTAVLLLNNAHVTNEVLTLNSINGAGALQVDATGDWIGPITLQTNVVIEASSLLQLGGVISGPGGFNKVGASILRMTGTDANTYAGLTTVTGGTLELNRNGSDGAIPGDLFMRAATTVRTLDDNQINNNFTVTMNAGSTLDLGTFVEAVGNVSMTGASVIGTGTLFNLLGTLTVNASATQSSISKEFRVTATRTIDVADGAAATDLLLSGLVSGAGGIIKNGDGSMSLTAANTYSGTTTINAGVVSLGSDTALGSTANGTTVNAGATLFFDFGVTTLPEVLTLNGTGSSSQGALYSIDVATIATNLTLASASTINVATNGGSPALLTINGVIGGAGSLTKEGVGTLTLGGSSGNNTYAGNTTVNEGVLVLNKTLAILSGTLTIGDGVGAAQSDVVRYSANGGLNSSVPIVIRDTGLLDLNGFSDTVGAITMIGGDITTGVGTMTINTSLTASSGGVGGTASITGNLGLGASTRTFTVTNGAFAVDLQVSAAISGNVGIIKAGDGFLTLAGSNSFSGAVTVSDGTLRLQDDFAAGTTAGGVTVNGDAILQLISGTHVGAEALTLNSTAGTGSLESLSGSNSWAGPVTLSINTLVNVDVGDTLNLLGSIAGPGGLTKIESGTLYYSGATANTYAGITTVNAGTLVLAKSPGNPAMTSNLVIGDGAGGVNADVVRTEVAAQLPDTTRVTVNSSGLFEITEGENFGSLEGSGNAIANVLPAQGLAPGGDNTSTIFSGVISGTGDFIKTGSGTMTLSGNNTYTGSTKINGGKLLVDGSQPQSPVIVGGVGILGGSGTVGNINNTAGGVISPGASPGILTSSNVVFSGASSDFTVELAGTSPGTGYDQLNVRGTNTLGGATLNVTAGFGLSNAPAAGDTFTILNNDAAEAITGTFAGLANGATFTADNLSFRINYNGGSGNDVVLTLTNVAAAEAGAFVSSGNGNATIDPNECNLINVVVSNQTASAMTGISAKLVSLTPGASVVQPFAAYPDIPGNSRRTNTSAFQLSTTTNFVCGQNVQLQLVLQTATHNSFAIPVLLTSGTPGSPVAFNNNAATAIPDGGGIFATASVSGITAPIGKVTVTLFLTHPQVQDMDITLEAPDGTIVELTTDNGASSANYGTSCAARTTFDDAAGTAITAGTAPFSGTFRPEGKLSDFRGKSGSDANGTWTLHLADDNFNGFTGSFQCWTINVSPATCAVGSGACELCPDVTITGALGTNSLQQTDRLFRDLPATACGAPTVTSGVGGSGLRAYDAYLFQNGPSAACITVTLEAPDADLFSAAYTNFFNPTNVFQNYVADSGDSTISPVEASPSPTRTYSFNVGAGQIFVVTVNEVGSTGPYTLQVSGGDCRPTLNVTALPGNQALLDWTTAATGYGLESTNRLITGVTNWPPVTNVPVVVNSRFNVTNSVAGTNQFFRLRKPLP